jgi:hypothetical protein
MKQIICFLFKGRRAFKLHCRSSTNKYRSATKQIFLEAQKVQIASYFLSGMEYLKIAVQKMWRVLEFEIFRLLEGMVGVGGGGEGINI